jgi:hypothetical protein
MGACWFDYSEVGSDWANVDSAHLNPFSVITFAASTVTWAAYSSETSEVFHMK